MDKETRKKKHFPLTLLTEYFNLCLCRCKSVYFCIHKVRTFIIQKCTFNTYLSTYFYSIKNALY